MQSLEFDGVKENSDLQGKLHTAEIVLAKMKAEVEAAEKEAMENLAALKENPVTESRGFVGVDVRIEIDWKYRMVVLMTSTGDSIHLTLKGARALALNLRQAANQIERARGR